MIRGPRLAVAPLALAIAGCDLFGPTTVEGRLLSAPDPDAAPIVGAVVALYDIEGQRIGHDDTDPDGFFRITGLPPDIQVATVVDAAPEYAPTVFVGSLGAGTMEVVDGALYALSFAEAGAWIDSYGDLAVGQVLDPAEDDSGGAVKGRVLAELEGGVLVPFPDVSAQVVTTSLSYGAVYLDVDGDPDPGISETSERGEFGVFNLPPGTWALRLSLPLADGTEGYLDVPCMVVEDGVTVIDNLVFQVS